MAQEKVTSKNAKRKKPTPQVKHKCLICGKEGIDSEFYKTKGSLIWTETDGRVLFCKDCLAGKFNLLNERYGERLAVMIMCHYVDAPYIDDLYQSLVLKEGVFDFGHYMRTLNGPQYAKKSFLTSLTDGEFIGESALKVREELEAKWTREDMRNKRECIELLGYDPFEDFSDKDRKLLFGDLMNYLDEDLLEDAYKLSMVIQIVISNNQIRAIDLQIAKLDPARAADEIKTLNTIKKDLVSSVANISKENEISVRNRSNKDVGKSTLTYLMKDLRKKGIEGAEANYYDMLQSPGTQWAADMSIKAIRDNTFFDEQDRQDLFMIQRDMIQKLQKQLDDATEENRLLKLAAKELEDG